MNVIRSIQLFFQEGGSDKLYNATIVEDAGKCTVKVEWGRRGSKLNEGSKAVGVPLATAIRKFDSLVREKRGKGYEEVTAEVAPAAIAPPMGAGSGSKGGATRRAKIGHAAQLLTALEDHELEAFLTDDTMIAQQKIDGMRVIAHIGEEIVATNRSGQQSKIDARALAGLASLPHGTIVDGELLDDGYWLFDVLQVGDEDLRDRGYHDRWALLDGELEPGLTGDVHVVPIAQGKVAKRKLHDRLRRAGAEGIVFKRADAPYTAGRPTSGGTQRKYKFIKSADVIVLENAGNAYQMAVYDGKAQVSCGKVFAGTTNASRKLLDAALASGERPICEVRYLYATNDHQLFQPVFVRIRDDKPASACLRAQLLQTCRKVVV